jgi:hypothetical protein
MNDQIRELARKAGLVRIAESKYAVISDDELKNLVLLIVKECVGKSKKQIYKNFDIDEKQ